MKKCIVAFLLIVPAVLLVMTLSCNTAPDPKYCKDGTQYGVTTGIFRERWWNFYERGCSFAEGEFWEEAVGDFQAAIRQRDGDQRRARTYGMHFVDYFPQRELGIAYYHLGRHEDALQALEASFEQHATGRAKFYLNKVRAVLVEAAGRDIGPPDIELATFADGAVTNSFALDLQGQVQDDTYAANVAVNDEPLFVELSARRIPFAKNIKLHKGLNEIKISSADLLGNVRDKHVAVFADFSGPAMRIDNLVDGQEVAHQSITLRGALADATGITTLRVNDEMLAYNKEREVDFTFTVQLNEGTNKIILAATDGAGNITANEFSVVYVPQLAGRKPDGCTPAVRAPIRLALSGSGMLDTGQHRLFAAARPQAPRAGLRLTLKDLADTQTVYYKSLYLDGSVSGTNTITSVAINGEPAFIMPGRTIYFNQLLDLQEGENIITIDVADEAGNSVSKTITLVRQISSIHQIGTRMSIAILPFEHKGDSSGISDSVYDSLVGSFFKQGRFNIVSRGAELESVLQELKLSQTDLVHNSKAVQVGRVIAADAILTGSIRETDTSIEIYARLVNTETSAVFDARDVYGQEKSLSHVQYLTDGLALKFKHSFPLLEGTVIKIAGDSIYADFGSLQHIKKDMKFIVFREDEKIIHPVTGRVLGVQTKELGVARIVNVFEDMSLGKLVADFDPNLIKVQDLIITR